MNRAFHIAGIAWIVVCLAVLGLGWPAAFLFAAGAGLYALLLLLARKRLPLWIFSATATVCFCSLCLWQYQDAGRLRETYLGTTCRIQGVVTDQILSDHAVETTLRLTGENPHGLKNARVLVRSRTGVEESIGDVVEYSLRLDASYPASLWARGFDFEAFGGQARLIGQAETAEVRLSRLRQAMEGRFLRLLPNGEGALLSAVLLGRTENLPNALRQTYSAAGLSHLLAVSGLHLTVMLSLAGIILERVRISRRLRLFLEMGMATGFAALTGFSPSILRAAMMLVLCRIALLLGRDTDTLNSLGFSVIVILLLNPYAVFSMSLQLSYLATMGIAAFTEPMAGGLGRILFRRDFFTLAETRPWTAAILSAVCVTLSAQALTTPLICWQFGRVSFISPLANLLAALPASAMLLFGIFCAGLGFFPSLRALCRLAAICAGLCARLVTWVAGLCASFPGASFPVQDDGVIFWIGAVTLLFAVLWYLHGTRAQILWAAEWAACALLVTLCAHLVFWGRPLAVCIPAYGETVMLLYGDQAAIIGVPGRISETEKILSLMSDYKIASLCLLIPEKEAQLETAAAHRLLRACPPEQIVPLDGCKTLEAALFGHTLLTREGESALRIESGGISLLKTFGMEPGAAHILINGRNEIITAPGIHPVVNSRYYGCSRLFLPVDLPSDGASAPVEVEQ